MPVVGGRRGGAECLCRRVLSPVGRQVSGGRRGSISELVARGDGVSCCRSASVSPERSGGRRLSGCLRRLGWRGHWRLLSKCMQQEAAEKAVIRLWQLHIRIQRRVCVRSSGKTLTLCPEYALFSH
ncbi:hypothetical protein MHYP_G00184930 [Metynnis hypsauchen]